MEQVKIKWSYEELATKTPVFCLSFAIVFACIVAKMFFCTITIDGANIGCEMVADYWNFGKDLLNGKELYKDLFDHKGAYLYFIYAFMVFLSSNNIWIVVLFETIIYALTVGAFYWYMKDVEISNKCSQNKIVALFPTSIFALVYLLITPSVALVNTEGISTLCFIIIWGILKKSQKVTPKMFLTIGIILGILFNFKITSIIPYIPLFAYACVSHIRSSKDYKILLKSIGMGVVGFVAINIPFLIYMTIGNYWGDFLQIYEYACSESNSNSNIIQQIFFGCCILIAGILFIIRKNQKIGELIIYLSSICFGISVGSGFNYYLAFYITIIFLGLFQFKNTNKGLLILTLFLVFLYGANQIKHSISFKEAANTKNIAEQYGITNENILYIWEDMGYGAYSSESFVEPYQWVPSRAFYSDEFTEYYTQLTVERLKNKQFKYVYAPPLELLNQINTEDYTTPSSNVLGNRNKKKNQKNMNKMYLEIVSYLKENYNIDEDYKYLYKAK